MSCHLISSHLMLYNILLRDFKKYVIVTIFLSACSNIFIHLIGRQQLPGSLKPHGRLRLPDGNLQHGSPKLQNGHQKPLRCGSLQRGSPLPHGQQPRLGPLRMFKHRTIWSHDIEHTSTLTFHLSCPIAIVILHLATMCIYIFTSYCLLYRPIPSHPTDSSLHSSAWACLLLIVSYRIFLTYSAKSAVSTKSHSHSIAQHIIIYSCIKNRYHLFSYLLCTCQKQKLFITFIN
jgi:hypothetical protein